MAKIKGIDVLVKIGETALGGQRGATLSRSSEAIDATTKDSNGWKENEYGSKEWSIDCDGLLIVDDAAFTSLETAFDSKEKVDVVVAYSNGTKYSGKALITEFPVEMPYDDHVSYTVSLIGDGPLTKALV